MLANKFNRLEFISLIYIVIIFAFLLQAVSFTGNSDDLNFSKALSLYDFGDYVITRYNGWSGRIFIEILLVKTINIMYFPQLLIAFSTLLLSYSIYKIALKGRVGLFTGIAISCTFLLSNYGSTDQAIIWITGAYNYVLPISIGMYSLSILKSWESESMASKVTACLLIVLACNNEQFAICSAIATLFLVASKAYQSKKIPTESIFFVFVLIGASIVLLAPGNALRYTTEVGNWMPAFDEYNIIHKLSLGLDRLNNHLVKEDNYLITAASLMLLINIFKRDNVDLVDIICGSFFCLQLGWFIFSNYPHLGYIALTRGASYLSPDNWMGMRVYISYLISLLTLFSLYVQFVKSDFINAKLIFLISLCGLCSVVMIGFSPTVYASGTRVTFLLDVSIALLACINIARLMKK